MTATRCNIRPCLLLLAVAVILLGVALPPLNTHAVERHASDAVRAYNYVKQNGGEHNCWQCKDGRLRYICPIDGSPQNLFAVVVLSPAGSLVTAFICRQDYAATITETGSNPWHYTHP